MPAEFNKLGLAFQYPENWTLDEDDAVAGNQSVTVYSPGGGFWTVAAHPRDMSPEKLAEAAVEAMQQEYEGVEIEEMAETMVGHELIGYDLNFFYLDLTNTATVRCFRTGQATYSVFCQAEDREFAQIGRVFEAMTTSFLNNLTRLRPRH